MQRKKHKRKVNHFIIFTTDRADGEITQFRIPSAVAILLVIVFCLAVGGGFGYAIYEAQIWDAERIKDENLRNELAEAKAKNDELQLEIEALNGKVELLSVTVNNKAEEAGNLQEEIAAQSVPTALPLNGAAAIDEVTEGEPAIVFHGSEGTFVVASGKGIVSAIEEDEIYGNRVLIDHGNGYVSVYRNRGEAQVKMGDEVAAGTTLFIISSDNMDLGYQIMLNGEFINPAQIISING